MIIYFLQVRVKGGRPGVWQIAGEATRILEEAQNDRSSVLTERENNREAHDQAEALGFSCQKIRTAGKLKPGNELLFEIKELCSILYIAPVNSH